MAPIDLKNIQWEDEEESSVKKNQSDEFAAMFASETFEDDHFPAGSQVEGTVAQIPQDSNDVIIELSRRHNGLIDKNELLDEQGELRVKEGDRIPLYVISSRGGEIQLSTSLSASRRAADDLYGAFRSALPVKGKVIKENSGGFDVMVLGKRAFCPVSQIDNHYVLNKGEYVNKEFNFLIEKIEEGGRNIVVSRAKLLARDAALKIEELKGRLKEDIILEGTVTDVRDFGAFVDLGGFQGFVHVSEMSFSRVSKATEFTHRGEKVRVKVLSIEEKDGKTRISCSMKAAQNDPWGDIASRLSVGASYQGEVKRLEKFGAFVEIEPGVEGLIHISEMSWQKRIHHPSDVVKAGDWVEVKVLDIDPTSRRISLSLKDAAGDPWQSVSDQFKPGALVTGKVVSLKGFGAIVEVAEGVTGLVPITALKSAYGESYRKKCSPPQTVELKVLEVRQAERQMLLAPPEAAQMDQVEQDYREYVQQQKEQKEKTAPTKAQGTFGALLAAKLRDKN